MTALTISLKASAISLNTLKWRAATGRYTAKTISAFGMVYKVHNVLLISKCFRIYYLYKIRLETGSHFAKRIE